jgi:hypothetical protein
VARTKKPKTPPLSEEARLTLEVTQAEQSLRALRSACDGSNESLRSVALSTQRVWDLRADLLQLEGKYDAARKASTTAIEAGKLAAKLAMSTVIDRVANLEAEVNLRRGFGASLKELE